MLLRSLASISGCGTTSETSPDPAPPEASADGPRDEGVDEDEIAGEEEAAQVDVPDTTGEAELDRGWRRLVIYPGKCGVGCLELRRRWWS